LWAGPWIHQHLINPGMGFGSSTPQEDIEVQGNVHDPPKDKFRVKKVT